jgi:hypothetical protein
MSEYVAIDGRLDIGKAGRMRGEPRPAWDLLRLHWDHSMDHRAVGFDLQDPEATTNVI